MHVLFPKKWRRLLSYVLFLPFIWILATSLQLNSMKDGDDYGRSSLVKRGTNVVDENALSSSSTGNGHKRTTQKVEAVVQGHSSGVQGHSVNSSVQGPSPTQSFNMSEKERLYYRRSTTIINPHNFSFVINPGYCSSSSSSLADPYLVIMVLANAPDVEKRMTIRQTWGNASVTNKWPFINITRTVRVYFLHAKTDNNYWESELRKESEEYGDIIQEDFTDSYRNLTLKSIMALKWVTRFCPQALYVMKVDDDVFVNTPFVLNLLVDKNPSRHVVGLISPKSKVRRKGKWETTVEEFPFEFFPTYTPGAGYVMSVSVARDLYELSQYVKPIWLEDVYITGILPKILGTVNHLGNDGFTDAMRRAPKVCDIVKGRALTGTRMSQNDLRKLWNDLTEASC